MDLSRLMGKQVPKVEVSIPPGLDTGHTIQVSGEGCMTVLRPDGPVPYIAFWVLRMRASSNSFQSVWKNPC